MQPGIQFFREAVCPEYEQRGVEDFGRMLLYFRNVERPLSSDAPRRHSPRVILSEIQFNKAKPTPLLSVKAPYSAQNIAT